MKYEGKEDNLQISVARVLDLAGVLWCHVANERKTSIIQGARLKKKGVKSGVPDVLIFEARGGFSGLAIELKAGNNKPTKNQLKWLHDLDLNGWKCSWSNDLDEILEIINEYLELKRNETKRESEKIS